MKTPNWVTALMPRHIPNYLQAEEPIYSWTTRQVIETGAADPTIQREVLKLYHQKQRSQKPSPEKSKGETTREALDRHLGNLASRHYDDRFMIACNDDFAVELYGRLWPVAMRDKTAGQVIHELTTDDKARRMSRRTPDVCKPRGESQEHIFSYWIDDLIQYGVDAFGDPPIWDEVNEYLKGVTDQATSETTEVLRIIHEVARRQHQTVQFECLDFSDDCWKRDAFEITEAQEFQAAQV